MKLKDIENELDKMYYCKGDYNSSVLPQKLIEYIEKNPGFEPEEESIILRKQASKHFTYLSDTKIDLTGYGNRTRELSLEQLIWISGFNEETIRIIEKKYSCDSCNNKIHTLWAHLYSHNSAICTKIADNLVNCERLKWLEKAYLMLNKSLKMEIDEKRVIFSALSGIEHKIVNEKINNREGIFWLIKAFYHKKRYADKNKEEIVFCKYLGDYAMRIADLFEKSGDQRQFKWLKKAAKYHERVLWSNNNEFSSDYKGFYVHVCKIFEKIAEQSENLDEKVAFFEKAYKTNKRISELTRKSDPKHSALSSFNAGKIKEKIFDITKNESNIQETIECYQTFFNYFNKNPAPELTDIFVGISRYIRRLKEKHEKEIYRSKKRNSIKKWNKKNKFRYEKKNRMF